MTGIVLTALRPWHKSLRHRRLRAHRQRIALAVLDQIIHIQPLARVSAGSCDLGVPSLSLANALALRLQMVSEPGPSGGR